MRIELVISLVVTLYAIVFTISKYNSFIELQNKVEEQFSQIDIELARSTDLISNLIEIVKGCAKHEIEMLEKVEEARNKYLSSTSRADRIKKSDKLNNLVNKLLALSDAYPDLKANEDFIQLQSKLKNTEDKIFYAKQFYNDTVLLYNNKIQAFPNNIIAGIIGFKKESFFKITKSENKM